MATADSVKAKVQGLIDQSNATTGNSDTDLTSAVNSLIAGFGQGGGIGAVKFVDEDITIAESTTTAVTYTIDGVEIPTLQENPNKWTTYSGTEVYICFITPKEVEGEYVKADNAVSSAMLVLFGHTNYGQTITHAVSQYGAAGSSLKSGKYGLTAGMGATSNVTNGVPQTSVNVVVQTTSGYFVPAGVYNVQLWMLTDFNWVK